MKDYEKILNIIYDNDILLEVLENFLLEENNLPEIYNKTNEIIGQEYRAYTQAKIRIQDRMNELKLLRTNKSEGNNIKYK